MSDPRWQNLVRRVAQIDPEMYDADSLRYVCRFCDASTPSHNPACPWQEATALIKEWDE